MSAEHITTQRSSIDTVAIADLLDKTALITRHHIDSFNTFYKSRAPKNLASVAADLSDQILVLPRTTVRLNVEFDNVRFNEPRLTPQECRLRDKSYTSECLVDIKLALTSEDGGARTERVIPNHLLFELPVLLLSDLCHLRDARGLGREERVRVMRDKGEHAFDRGGYFIANGREMVLVSQEVSSYGVPIINKLHKGIYEIYIRTIQSEYNAFPKLLTIHANQSEMNVVALTGINGSIPLATLFRLLGAENDLEIAEAILLTAPVKHAYDDLLPAIFRSSNDTAVYSSYDAVRYTASRLSTYSPIGSDPKLVKAWLARDVFPGERHKLNKLGLVVRKLFDVMLGITPVTDRQSQAIKRYNTTGDLISQLFRDGLGDLRNNILTSLRHTRYPVDDKDTRPMQQYLSDIGDNLFSSSRTASMFSSTFITSIYLKSLTGTWGNRSERNKMDAANAERHERSMISSGQSIKRANASAGVENGVAVEVNRLSQHAYLSQLTSTIHQIPDGFRDTTIRQLHPSTLAYLCLCDSADGANIGISKHLTLGSTFTIDMDTDGFEDFLFASGVVPLSADSVLSNIVYLNDRWIGGAVDLVSLHATLISLRREGAINPMVGIYLDHYSRELFVRTDSGRPIRMLHPGHKRHPVTQDNMWGHHGYFDTAHRERVKGAPTELPVIEWIDVQEQQNTIIAVEEDQVTPHTTHVEVHPALFLGANASMISFLNHAPVVRGTLATVQGRQMLTSPLTNLANRYDPLLYTTAYAQRPLTTTAFNVITDADQLPNGTNLRLTIALMSGYNQEDGGSWNRHTVERGALASYSYHTFKYTEEVEDMVDGNRSRIQFGNPSRYNLDIKKDLTGIDKDGLPIVGTILEPTKAIVGMVEVSRTVDGEKNIVDRVVDKSPVGGYNHGTVESYIVLKEGDLTVIKVKVRDYRLMDISSKASCGLTAQKGVACVFMPPEDMPYTDEGEVPDYIFNPLGTITRLSCNLILDIVAGKYAAKWGRLLDATAFSQMGLSMDEVEIEEDAYYSGITGDKLPVTMFSGFINMHRLKQEARDKLHSVDKGRVSTLTRQAAGGRRVGGPSRMGGMETNNMVSHGWGLSTHENLMRKADLFPIAVDPSTGKLIDNYSLSKNTFTHRDGSIVYDRQVSTIPYAAKLLQQELEACGIDVRYKKAVKSDESDEHAMTADQRQDYDAAVEDDLATDQ